MQDLSSFLRQLMEIAFYLMSSCESNKQKLWDMCVVYTKEKLCMICPYYVFRGSTYRLNGDRQVVYIVQARVTIIMWIQKESMKNDSQV